LIPGNSKKNPNLPPKNAEFASAEAYKEGGRAVLGRQALDFRPPRCQGGGLYGNSRRSETNHRGWMYVSRAVTRDLLL